MLPRSSITRLRFAFAAMAGLTLLALVVGCITFALSYKMQRQLADETTPLLIDIEQLSRVAIDFASAARELETVDSQARLDRLLPRYALRNDALQAGLLELADLELEADLVSDMEDVTRQFDDHEQTYVTTLRAKTETLALIGSIRREIYREGQALLDRIAPMALNSSLALIDEVDAIRIRDQPETDRLAEILNETQLLSEVASAVERFLHAVGQGGSPNAEAQATTSRADLAPEYRRMTQLALKLRAPDNRQALALSLQTLERKTLGAGGFNEQAANLSAAAGQLDRLNLERAMLLDRLTDLVDKIVTEARNRFYDDAEAAQRRSLIAVIALVLLAVFALVAAVWIGSCLIDRDIARRLERLAGSTVALAKGDLDVSIDQSGSDELAEMACAAEIFRRNARALRQAEIEIADRLVEVEAANVRLLDANTALDQANAELAESELRYQLAVEGTTVGIWDYDARNDELFWSDRYKALLGISDEETTRSFDMFRERLHPDDRDRVAATFESHLKDGEIYDIEYRLRRTSGDFAWFHSRGQALLDGEGRPIRVAGSIDDITERKQAELRLERYARELERSNQELDQFAYIASHDLKEPLRAVYNHASFLLEDYADKLDDDGEKRLHRLIKLSERMEKLIANLLYFSRLGRGDQTMEVLDLNDVVANVEVDLEETLTSRHARIEMPARLPPISGHPAHITAIFQNLISNGTKYNDAEEKVIEIGCLPDGGDDPAAEVTFYVRDNGIGIEDQFRDDVFRLFKRLNAERAYGEGTGAGLTFVKKIVENHGGRIWLRSDPGEGTTFFFTLKSASPVSPGQMTELADQA